MKKRYPALFLTLALTLVIINLSTMATPTAQSTRNLSPGESSYTYQLKPGGVDYFVDGRPVPREEWSMLSGIDYKTIDPQFKPVQGPMLPTSTTQTKTMGAIQGPQLPTTDPEASALLNLLSSMTSGGSSAAAPAPQVFQPRSFNGTMYYDQGSYDTAARGYIDATNRDQLATLDQGLKKYTGYTDPSRITDINSVAEDSEFGRGRSSLLRQIKDLLEGYDKSETQAQGNLMSYYSNLGDAYQSSQGVRQAESAADYAKARADANRQQTEGLSSLQRTLQDYIQGYNTNRTNVAKNYTSALDSAANSNIGELQTILNRQLTPTDIQYNAPMATAATTNNQSSLVKALQKGASNTFKLQTPTGQKDPNSILQFLYGTA